MALFLVFSIPLTGLIVLRSRFSEYFAEPEVWKAFFRGTASFLIIVLPVYILILLYDVRYLTSELYLRFLAVDFLFLLIPAVGAFFLREYRSCKELFGRRLFVRIFAFFHGFFALTGVFAGYMYHPAYSGYRLFAYPVLILFLVCVTTTVFYLFMAGTHWARYLFLPVPLLFSMILTTIPLLFMLHHMVNALLVFGLLFILMALLFFLVQVRRILPGM